MKRIICVAMLAAACGSDTLNPSDPVPLSSAFAGRWMGATTVAVQGADPYSSSSYIDVAVSGNGFTAANICPGQVTAVSISGIGSARSGSWKGSQACPPLPGPPCPGAVFTLVTASAILSDDQKILVAEATGTLNGCGYNGPAIAQFVGWR